MTSHSHSNDNTVPRPALAMALGLVAVSLAMTAAVRFGLAEQEAVPAAARAASGVAAERVRQLTFADREDGAVVVRDADTGTVVAVLQGENDGGGFVRGVLRGMARDRTMRGVGQEPPFTLTLWRDGSLSLADAATGRTVELGGFGPDNRAAFLRFVAAETR